MKHIVVDARIRKASSGRPVERLLDNIEAIDRENEYTVLLSPGDTWRPKADNFKVRTVNYKQFSLNPLEQISFAWLLYKLKPDVVFFSMTQYPLLYFGKIVVFTHDLSMFRWAHNKEGSNKLVHTIKILGYKLLFWAGHRKANKIIVPTKFVEKELIKYQSFTRDKIVQIYEAVDEPKQFEARKPKIHAKKFIFFVGNAFPHKNLYQLIDAFALIKDKYPELSLILAGKEDYYYKKVKQYVREKGIKNIEITGFVTDAELHWLYQNTEFFVYPSLSEGFGIPPLEAMANNCAVAVSNRSCIPEVCGDAVEYFNPDNKESIAKSLVTLIESPRTRTELISKGQKQIKKYSWAKMSQEIIETIQKLL
ncbi:MAG: glycosyltransferase family 1 protein [Patescibacteria group bacterium]